MKIAGVDVNLAEQAAKRVAKTWRVNRQRSKVLWAKLSQIHNTCDTYLEAVDVVSDTLHGWARKYLPLDERNGNGLEVDYTLNEATVHLDCRLQTMKPRTEKKHKRIERF
ncbi:uncharacterized protein PHALS_00641 [Plasmopara halstedii]|uniref:Uncharacterized protein n=1 Tax=Plasmopara halstedii TaxID=4781 RepID=A0A0P1B932_PLAHL|nr:uncharacterized protein PHALS_00641 [Plasmopara halstedii]CEG50502.1 hypothetical protein PHALS_00641 [Plasmopara halstedii]|eukprot:XP_024586871.1 hypothetical protein PHALS_00641 [Plasmopara halstedii]